MAIVKQENKNEKNKFYSGIRAIIGGFMRFIFRVEMVNPENEPTDGTGMIVCCNHLSNADVIILIASMKNQIHFLAKEELFRVPLIGQLVRAIGAFPIKRGVADVGAIKKTIALAKAGHTVGFFPQGTRKAGAFPSQDTVRSGIGMIASHTKVDILPVALVAKGFRIKAFRKTKLVIGKPISHEALVSSVNSEITGKNGITVTEQYKRISGEIFGQIIELADKNRF